jgi:hypothetical protein
MDTALLPLIDSPTVEQADAALAALFENQIRPVVEKTLRSKLRVSLKPEDFTQANQDGLELAGEVNVLLTSELGRLRSNPNGKVIHNLAGYVVSVTVNAYRQYLRAKYPLRHRLRSKLRYLLTHHPDFALWEDEPGWFCGFRRDQRSQSIQPPDAAAIQAGIADVVDKNNLRDHTNVIDLLTAIFQFAGVPILFTDLLSVVADIQGIKDHRETTDTESFFSQEQLHAQEDSTLSAIEQREILKKAWAEVCELPLRHRAALLLNLRDRQGDAVVWLLPLLRIASIRQIAEALEFPVERFAAIWRELPWDDLVIAEHLDLTRQQVINLRQSARARLVRQVRISC